MVSALLIVVIILILIVITLVIVILVMANSQSSPCVTDRNFELEFTRRLRDPDFARRLEENPKEVLEEELSRYIRMPFQFTDNVNVKIFRENPDDLHLLIPPEGGLPLDRNSPLMQVMQATGDRQAYGLFMGNLEGFWWHLGLRAGSCISDIEDEIGDLRSRDCLRCSD